MELKQFLTKLYGFGIESNYFEISEIGKLDKTCCKKATLEIIDFDKTKEIICKRLGQMTYKSCDALKIFVEKESIDFIEMKGLDEYVNPKYPNKSNLDKNMRIEGQIKEKISSFHLLDKMEHSIDLLKLIIRDDKFNLTKTESKLFKESKKNFIILTDIDLSKNGFEFILASLDVLSENSASIENICMEIFNEEIENINFPNIYNIQKPIPMNCEGLIKYYT